MLLLAEIHLQKLHRQLMGYQQAAQSKQAQLWQQQQQQQQQQQRPKSCSHRYQHLAGCP
jgi:hypothetical protein